MRRGHKRLAQQLREPTRDAPHRNGAEFAVLIELQLTEGTPAEAVCFIQYRLEHRREVAGRTVDDPQHLGGRGLLLQGLVTLGIALVQPALQFRVRALKIGDDLLRIGECAVRRRAHLRTSSDRPPNRIIPPSVCTTTLFRSERSVRSPWITRLAKETGRPVWFLLTDRPTDPEAGGASWPACTRRVPRALR
jgi:hypothetical protein